MLLYISILIYTKKEYLKLFKKKGIQQDYITQALLDMFNMQQKFLEKDTLVLPINRNNELVALKLIEEKQAIIINKETNQRVFNIAEEQFEYAVNKRLVGEYGKKLYFLSPKKVFFTVIKGHY